MSKHWLPAVSDLHEKVDGLSLDDLGLGSRAVTSSLHVKEDGAGREVPLTQPITHSSTYIIKSVDHYLDILNNGGYIYSRLGNPTCEAVECAINDLEGGAGSMVFATGMAAINTALFAWVKAGDHIVALTSSYSGTIKTVKEWLPRFGVEYTLVPAGCDMETYRKAIKPNTTLLYSETPCNPLNSVMDLEELAKLGQSIEGAITVVDSTYASPYLQQPCKLGVDVSIHSGTKYLGGHSDLLAGVLTTRTKDLWTTFNLWRTNSGNTLSPFDASLLLRGIRTIHIRMDRHCSNAMLLAEFLEGHEKVSSVSYPGLKSDPGHEIAKKQMSGFGGMIAFEMKGGFEAAKTVVQSVRLIKLAVSLGSVHSLMQHPASMTHGPMIMNDDARKAGCITAGLIRFNVGIEDPEDLLRDLKQAIEKA